MALQSDILKPYTVPSSFPQDPQALVRFLRNELQTLATTNGLLIQVVKKIDARLVAHSI
jgi:hypothetical protein